MNYRRTNTIPQARHFARRERQDRIAYDRTLRQIEALELRAELLEVRMGGVL